LSEQVSLKGKSLEKSQRKADTAAIDLIFKEARTFYAWEPTPVPETLLHELYDLFKLGPTSANSCPARVIFLTTSEAKERLLPAMSEGNVLKTRTAPVVAIVAYDTQFYEYMHVLYPSAPDARSWFEGKPDVIQESGLRNSSLQGAYLILAARALGLDCGPMTGFQADAVNAEFFPDGRYKVNFICNLGYGDGSRQKPRSPRLAFDQACQIL